MEAKYIIRLDDACATMNWSKWDAIFEILDKFHIKPIIAVIPNNEDESLIIDNYNDNFWNEVKRWQEKGYYIAMHGYNHKYISQNSGLIPMNNQSEFAGVDIKIQREKIKKAWEIFNKHKIIPKIWVAPSHTFDKNTLKVLKEETNIRIISDGIAFYPYNKYGFFWIPQQLWWYQEKEEGIWTICLHPNNMSIKSIKEFELFISNNKDKFNIYIEDLLKMYRNRKLILKDYIYFYIFFLKRQLSIIKRKFKEFKGIF